MPPLSTGSRVAGEGGATPSKTRALTPRLAARARPAGSLSLRLVIAPSIAREAVAARVVSGVSHAVSLIDARVGTWTVPTVRANQGARARTNGCCPSSPVRGKSSHRSTHSCKAQYVSCSGMARLRQGGARSRIRPCRIPVSSPCRRRWHAERSGQRRGHRGDSLAPAAVRVCPVDEACCQWRIALERHHFRYRAGEFSSQRQRWARLRDVMDTTPALALGAPEWRLVPRP